MLIIKILKNGQIENINKYNLNFLNTNNILKLHTWIFNNNEYVLYGSDDGKAGNENKYELPPPIDSNLYFNDLYVIKYNNEKILDFSIKEWDDFYNISFGGFDDIDSNDEFSSELSEHTSDRDFIDDDDIDSIENDSDNISDVSFTDSNISNDITDDENAESDIIDESNINVSDIESDINDDIEINDISSCEVSITLSDEEELIYKI